MNVIIRDLDKTRIHFEAAVARLGEQAATRAFNRALNREGDKIRTRVRRALRQQTGAKASLINRETRSIRSSFSNLTYTIKARGDYLGLSHFRPRQFGYGVRAKPWGRWQKLRWRFPGRFAVQQRLRPRGAGKAANPQDVWSCDPEGDAEGRNAQAFETAQPNVLAEAMRQIGREMSGSI